MKLRLMTPGPTPVPEEVLLELAKPVTYHRTAEARAILGEVLADMQYVHQTTSPVICLTSSGTGGMEAAVSNLLAPGQKAILLTAGRWGERWKGIAKAFGVNLILVEEPYGKAVAPERLADALKQHPDAVAVFTTLSETATGVVHDIEGYGKLVAETPAVLVVDGISGLGANEFRMDAWKVDICVSGSQKALMMPPGLAFVAVSDKAWKVIEGNTAAKAFYFDLKRYKAKLPESDTPFTPANTLIKAQRVALKRIRAETIEGVWKRHTRLAAAAQGATKALGLELFAERPGTGLTVVTVPGGIDGNAVLSHMEKRYGVKAANGQDSLKGKIWRFSHMGYSDLFDVLAGFGSLEQTLNDLGYKVELGAGVAAAQKAFAAA